MAQQLRAFAALAEDPGLIPSIHTVANKPLVISVPEDAMSSSGLCKHCVQVVHRNMWTKHPHTWFFKNAI